MYFKLYEGCKYVTTKNNFEDRLFQTIHSTMCTIYL